MASHTQAVGSKLHLVESAQGRIRTGTLIRARDFKSLAAAVTPLGHKKIQDLFAMRPWSSRVLSEVTSRHSCKSDSIKPRMRTIIAFQKRLLYCLGDHLRDIHPVLVQGNFPESRETHLRRERRARFSTQRVALRRRGGPRGISPNPNGSFSSYWRLLRKCQLV